jgi:hypothetical protein
MSPKEDFEKVQFDVQDENDSYIDIIKALEGRTNKPFMYSKIELQFLEYQT